MMMMVMTMMMTTVMMMMTMMMTMMMVMGMMMGEGERWMLFYKWHQINGTEDHLLPTSLKMHIYWLTWELSKCQNSLPHMYRKNNKKINNWSKLLVLNFLPLFDIIFLLPWLLPNGKESSLIRTYFLPLLEIGAMEKVPRNSTLRRYEIRLWYMKWPSQKIGAHASALGYCQCFSQKGVHRCPVFKRNSRTIHLIF